MFGAESASMSWGFSRWRLFDSRKLAKGRFVLLRRLCLRAVAEDFFGSVSASENAVWIVVRTVTRQLNVSSYTAMLSMIFNSFCGDSCK
jgi:hypothetical protein